MDPATEWLKFFALYDGFVSFKKSETVKCPDFVFSIYDFHSFLLTFQPRCVFNRMTSKSYRDSKGFGRNKRWHCLAEGSKIFASGPIGHMRDMTTFSRNGSIGGFVT